MSENELFGSYFEHNRKNKFQMTKEKFDQIMNFSKNGLSSNQIRQYFNVTKSDWVTLIKKYPKIETAMDCGLAWGVSIAGEKLMELVDKRNLPAIIFYLKSKGLWTENPLPEVPDRSVPAMSITINDPIEAAKIYQKVMTGS